MTATIAGCSSVWGRGCDNAAVGVSGRRIARSPSTSTVAAVRLTGSGRRRGRFRRTASSSSSSSSPSSSSSEQKRSEINPDLSYDEEFCILDRGCGHVMRQLTESPEDISRLDDLLSQVSFDASREEWIALLSAATADVAAHRNNYVGNTSFTTTNDHNNIMMNNDNKVRLGAMGVFNDEKDLIGLSSTVVYDDGEFGWIGNIVVREDYRKRGVASMMLRAALDVANAGCYGASGVGGGGVRDGVGVITALLDASEMGLPLYLKAGFIPVSRVLRYSLSKKNALALAEKKDDEAGRRSNRPTPPPSSLQAIDWNGEAGDAVRAADVDVFGADRGALLSAWRDTCPELSVWNPGVAYSLAHIRGNHVYLGPAGVLASTGNTRPDEKMIRDFFDATVSLARSFLVEQPEIDEGGVDGVVVYVREPLHFHATMSSKDEEGDVAGAGAAPWVMVREALEVAGFELQETTTRMTRPGIDEPGDTTRCLTVASLDLG